MSIAAGRKPIFIKRVLTFIWLILMVQSSVSCGPKEDEKFHQLGLSFEYPANWSANISENIDNKIIANTSRGVFNRHSAQIEFIVFEGVNEAETYAFELEHEVDRASRLFGYQELQMKTPATTFEQNDKWGKSVIVEIPTSSMVKGSRRNQTGQFSNTVMQPLEIIYIEGKSNRAVLIWFFMSLSEDINLEAKHIIESIQFD